MYIEKQIQKVNEFLNRRGYLPDDDKKKPEEETERKVETPSGTDADAGIKLDLWG